MDVPRRAGSLPRKQHSLKYPISLGMSLPEEMKGRLNRIPATKPIPSLPVPAPAAPASLRGGCLGLPPAAPQVLSLTLSGYFCLSPSRCLIHFHVKSMISKSLVCLCLPADWPECGLSVNDAALTAGNELNYSWIIFSQDTGERLMSWWCPLPPAP